MLMVVIVFDFFGLRCEIVTLSIVFVCNQHIFNFHDGLHACGDRRGLRMVATAGKKQLISLVQLISLELF
jgi:hypothetical protein